MAWSWRQTLVGDDIEVALHELPDAHATAHAHAHAHATDTDTDADAGAGERASPRAATGVCSSAPPSRLDLPFLSTICP